MTRNLKTVAQFASEGPFTEPSLRWMIFQSEQNGLANHKAIVRVGGRRIYIDPEAFERWVDSQQPQQSAA